nr:hypothetical protein [Tanacetum cinerariifolium]
MLRACPHHGFSELTQIDTFYNGLNEQDQDSLNAAAGGNLLIEKTCVICGGAHAYYDCIATDSNQPSVCAAMGTYNQVSLQNQANHQIPPPSFAPVQNNPNRYNPNQGQGNNFNREIIFRIIKVVERDTKESTNKEHSNCQGSTAHIQPLVVPISIPEPDVLKTQPNFADTLLLMPKFASTIKSLLMNKDKLFELAKVPLNENCSAMLLKNLPEKLEDLDKFLIPCDFPRIDRIDQLLIPKELPKTFFVKVGKFHFPTDFVVVDFEADLRVPLILGRSFLRTGRALIDVYGEEITLRVNDESYNSKSSNPTLVSNPSFSKETKSEFCKEPIVKSSSPILTPFGESDFFLEEIKDFLSDESIPAGIENSFYDPEGDILYLEKLLNEDPFQLPPIDLKQAE